VPRVHTEVVVVVVVVVKMFPHLWYQLAGCARGNGRWPG
jgi:hypothetical protein